MQSFPGMHEEPGRESAELQYGSQGGRDGLLVVHDENMLNKACPGLRCRLAMSKQVVTVFPEAELPGVNIL